MSKVSKPSTPGRFTVGHDTRGRWFVCDRLGVVGGVFVNQAAALHFARRESGNAPGAVCCVPDTEVMDFVAMLGPVQPRRFRRAA